MREPQRPSFLLGIKDPQYKIRFYKKQKWVLTLSQASGTATKKMPHPATLPGPLLPVRTKSLLLPEAVVKSSNGAYHWSSRKGGDLIWVHV